MVNLNSKKKCAQLEGSKRPSFGATGTKKRGFCAGHDTGGMVRGDASAVPPDGFGGSSSVTTRRPAPSRQGQGIARPTFPPAIGSSLSSRGRGRSRDVANSIRTRTVQPTLASSARVQATGTKHPVVVAESPSSSPPDYFADDAVGAHTTAVKREDVVLSSGVVVGDNSAGGGGSAECGVDNAKRVKRKAQVSTSAAQAIADGVASSGKSTARGSSANRRSGKRARQGDVDVVVLEPTDRAATTRPGASIAIKPER